MPWLRFVWIALLHWITNLALVMAVLRFALPQGLRGFALAAIPWLLSFILAFFYTEWAFRHTLPDRRTTVLLLCLWLVIGYSLHLFYAAYMFNNVFVVLRSPDLHLTYLFEIAAILLAAYVTRRRRIKAALGEGMEE